MTKQAPFSDTGIKFEAFLANADKTAGQHLGTIIGFGVTPANTPYEKRDGDGNLIGFQYGNLEQSIQLTGQFKTGAAVPEVNEEILLIPTSVHDRNFAGIYQVVADPVPTRNQQGVRTIGITARRAMNGDYMQTQTPVPPALIYVESYDADTHKFTLRNIGGASAAYGEEAIITNPDRLVIPAGYELPAAVDADAGTYTPSSTDMAKATSREVTLTAIVP